MRVAEREEHVNNQRGWVPTTPESVVLLLVVLTRSTLLPPLLLDSSNIPLASFSTASSVGKKWWFPASRCVLLPCTRKLPNHNGRELSLPSASPFTPRLAAGVCRHACTAGPKPPFLRQPERAHPRRFRAALLIHRLQGGLLLPMAFIPPRPVLLLLLLLTCRCSSR